mmetsp:Transcript_24406/g.64378  ORF Transcript_24406/g.64378 Transcript_24406/m.64378 type:complete len:149 (-) Transcript_24406:234-680(-)|eukprot:CAMPEP_0174888390 /NCGR_PEP_ID=MMETSP0167-20121228/3649_1 /TAXON_ID=38298 /ORGANISM="Rhodella maculata, Strain CCMP736" /LENGTH=148 /DNA_ID=CAMNT_0016125351 /DNA_START=71 /DNA_END=517 /DNA_ORIENTATION=-
MSASGIVLSDEVLETFKKLNNDRLYSAIGLKLDDAMTKIIVDESLTMDHVDADAFEAAWGEYIDKLPDNEPRFIVADWAYIEKADNAPKEKTVHIFWCPEGCKIRLKTVSSTSMAVVHETLNISVHTRADDDDTISYEGICHIMPKNK